MTEKNPYEQLGVTEGSSFEEIQAAKKRICDASNDDPKLIENIEAAYDAVIMDRLRLRQEGKIKVPERIRFPEKKVEPSVPKVSPIAKSPNWLQSLLDKPSQREVLVPSGVFLAFALVVAVSPAAASMSTLPLLLASGFIASVYFLNSKEKRFGRSLLITLVMLIVGVILGSNLAGSLANSGLAIGQPEQFAAVVTFVLFWLASCFLK